jgi:putative mRNA 3-end processing factor
MFYWEDGLKLAVADLAIDFRRRQPRAFISHAHGDHIARHEYALCTPATAALYRLRLGPRPTLDMPYRSPIEWGGLRLTTYPAGHCLGSAMLLAEDGSQSLLYTGDFKLGPSATSEEAELPRADLLVIESTYGTPAYRLPPRHTAIEQLCEVVRGALGEGRTPVIEAYALGKAQEVTKILSDAGFAVFHDPEVARISEVYEKFGVRLGCRGVCDPAGAEPGCVLVAPPRRRRRRERAGEVHIAVTGWAVDPRAQCRLCVDHAVPLSDHADYDDLIEAVRRVGPRKVYCTHGPESFVDRLREEGFDAAPLGRAAQGRWFD